MLSSEERRQLGEIESRLESDDPELAGMLHDFRLQRRRWWIVPLSLAWVGFAAALIAQWWIVALILLGPLVALTVAKLANASIGGHATHLPPKWPW